MVFKNMKMTEINKFRWNNIHNKYKWVKLASLKKNSQVGFLIRFLFQLYAVRKGNDDINDIEIMKEQDEKDKSGLPIKN